MTWPTQTEFILLTTPGRLSTPVQFEQAVPCNRPHMSLVLIREQARHDVPSRTGYRDQMLAPFEDGLSLLSLPEVECVALPAGAVL